MNSMQESLPKERQSDLEIYLKQVASDEIIKWISSIISIEQVSHSNKHTLLLKSTDEGQKTEVVIHEAAAGKAYTSVWFKTNPTQWADDLSFARAAFNRFGTEVRCANGGWKEDENPDEAWWKLNDQGESLVAWI